MGQAMNIKVDETRKCDTSKIEANGRSFSRGMSFVVPTRHMVEYANYCSAPATHDEDGWWRDLGLILTTED